MQVQAQLAKTTQHLLIQAVGDETLIYDQRRHQAFCLDRLASSIWHHADGTRTATQIAAATSLQLGLAIEEEAVVLGLSQLQRDGLLHQPSASGSGAALATVSSVSRRAMIGRVGLGAAMMVPVIATVIAPKAAQAYNGCVNCTPSTRRVPPPQ